MDILQLAGATDNTYAGVEKFRKSVFVARNPTVGTGIASLDGAVAYDATEALMTVYNSASATNGDVEWIQPIMLRLKATAVNTSATTQQFTISLDNINRYTSGGTTLTGAPLSQDTATGWSARTSKATINFGVVVAPAASSDNIIVSDVVASRAIYAANDTTEIWFGSGAVTSTGAVTDHAIICATPAPIHIGRGCTMTVHAYGASQAADPAFEVEFFYLEHPPTTI